MSGEGFGALCLLLLGQKCLPCKRTFALQSLEKTITHTLLQKPP